MSTADHTLPLPAPEPTHQTLEQAAEWFALLRSGDATDDDQSQWRAWLDTTQENRTAWAYVERISGRFEPVQASPERRSVARGFRTANNRMARRRQVLASLAVMAGGGSLLGWALWRHTPLAGSLMARMADYRSATGEVRDVLLPDGTQVWLGTASAFDQDYRADLRRLRLVAGEIMVQTAADPHRPFVIDTPQGRLRALGTRFTVRLESHATQLAVLQGAVEIRTADTGATRILQSGQQARFTDTSVDQTQPVDPAREAWTRGILIADDTPLADVLRELQRYRGGHLGVAPEVAHLPVAGSYPATDPDRALAMLEAVLPIRVKRTLSWWISVEPREGFSAGG